VVSADGMVPVHHLEALMQRLQGAARAAPRHPTPPPHTPTHNADSGACLCTVTPPLTQIACNPSHWILFQHPSHVLKQLSIKLLCIITTPTPLYV